MKIVLIGAGSYVFGPTVLEDSIVRRRMVGELALAGGEALEEAAKEETA